MVADGWRSLLVRKGSLNASQHAVWLGEVLVSKGGMVDGNN